MRRIPELRPLSRDHHHGLVLARHAREAAAARGALSIDETWDEVERRFRDELRVHFAIEEEYLVPGLEELGEKMLTDRLRDDHWRLREAVRPTAPRTVESLRWFGKALEQHIRFEERELFETAQSRLPKETLKAVERACTERAKS
jgi:hypothetical protein